MQPGDLAGVPAAAGGPKGLALLALDRFLFGEWLPHAPRKRVLVGVWRLAAAAQRNPVAAIRRFEAVYLAQRYPRRPTPAWVSRVCREMLVEIFGHEGEDALAHPDQRLLVLASRGRGALARPGSRRAEALGFALASAANVAGRGRLARFLERVVFHDPRDDVAWLRDHWDPFATRFAALTRDNLHSALLASGSIPLLLEPVADIAGAPSGAFWDGGLVDYHRHLPYPRLPGLVLYPHFGGRPRALRYLPRESPCRSPRQALCFGRGRARDGDRSTPTRAYPPRCSAPRCRRRPFRARSAARTRRRSPARSRASSAQRRSGGSR